MSELTPKVFFEEKMKAGLEANADDAKSIGAKYVFKIEGDDGGDWTVDMANIDVHAGADDDAQCTIFMEDTDFVDMIKGDLPGPQAFMQGKLRIEGDMALAMQLQELFDMEA